jgi:spore coat protein U-like protein
MISKKSFSLASALIFAAGVGAVSLPDEADAATATASIIVSATVLSFCTISALPLLFGNYQTAVLNATTTVTVLCTPSTGYNVGLDVGGGTGATIATRKMTSGVNLLNYQLFSDTTRLVVWGPTIGTNTVTGTGSGLAQILTVYGQVPASQQVTPGAYTDTVTATITY